MASVSPTDEFRALVARPPEGIPLDVGCLLIAAHAHPAAEAPGVVPAGLAALDAIAQRCPGPDLDDVRGHLFGTLGFAGNRRRYDDPRNSFLDVVLQRRLGIPITLAVVVIEVGRRVGLSLAGVGMPGHFLVAAGEDRYLDAFDGGRVLDGQGCRERFVELAGPGAPWSPELLERSDPRVVLARVLANLRQLFAQSQDLRGLDWVLELRLGIPGVPAAERADRASVLSALGRYDEAARELERLAETEEAGSDGLAGEGVGARLAAGAQGRPSDGHAEGEAAAGLRARAAQLRARLN